MSGKEIHTKETFQVLGMSCAVCALNVETTLGAQEGVYEAKVNFAGSTVLVDYDPQVITPVELQKAVESAGYELVVENTEDTDQADRLQREEFLALKRKTIGAIVLAIPVFVIGMFFMHMPYGNWIMLAFTIPVMAFFGRDFFVHAYMQLKHGRANMDTLVAVSTGVAIFVQSVQHDLAGILDESGIGGSRVLRGCCGDYCSDFVGAFAGGKGQVQYFDCDKEIDGVTTQNGD